MTITHHPSDETLAAYAAGTLDEPRRLIVATHLSLCEHCHGFVSTLEHAGGILLDHVVPVAMQPGALRTALQRLPTDQSGQTQPQSGRPAPLADYEIGRWRWIGRGVQWRSVGVPVESGTRVFMLRAAPGTRLPHHRHEGIEWTCVLEGAFRHEGGRYGPGDFDEADESDEHRPVIEEGVSCVCIVALQGNIELQGWFGRLLQPLIRI